MKKILQILGLLVSLSFHAPAWGDKADNGVECSVVMEKTSFDPRAAFPDFKLVFVNKGEKAVRLFDDFYPLKERGPNIIIKIWSQGNGKKGGKASGMVSSLLSNGTCCGSYALYYFESRREA